MFCAFLFIDLVVRFNSTEEGGDENLIVTGNGQFVVAWDFTKVKRGRLDKYAIQWCALFFQFVSLFLTVFRYPNRVVQDDFRYGTDKDIVSSTFHSSPHSFKSLVDRGFGGQRPIHKQETTQTRNSSISLRLHRPFHSQ